jgi:hypothetical protein
MLECWNTGMLEYWNGGMLGKDCSTCWRAGVLACTRTGEDARTPILKHPIIPTFHHSIIPLLVTPLFVTAHCYCLLLLPTATAPPWAAGLPITSLECWGKIFRIWWRAGVLACTRTGEDARTPILKHPIIPTFHHSIIPLLVTPLFVIDYGYCRKTRRKRQARFAQNRMFFCAIVSGCVWDLLIK